MIAPPKKIILCRQCGQLEQWCKVYTGCPLNKGKEHKLYEKILDKKDKP